MDNCEPTYFDRVNRAILDALLELKRIGTFGNDTYMVIWFSDSADEIMNDSAKALNGEEVYSQYAAVFQQG
jgi:hypothetical protein